MIRLNPRSVTAAEEMRFKKRSTTLSLKEEADELNRCRRLSIQTEHVRVPDLINYDQETNTLTAEFIPNSRSLYNALWNGTSFPLRMIGKNLEKEMTFSILWEIGKWLRLYHETTDYPDSAKNVARDLMAVLKEKVAYISEHYLLPPAFLNSIDYYCRGEFEKICDPAYRQANNLKLCRVQGDFIASNILLNDLHHIFIADFADTHIGVSAEDIGRFCEQVLAISQCGAYRKKFFETANKAFLNGYGLPEYYGECRFFKAVVMLNGLISVITEFTTRPYISRQLFTRYELKRLMAATLEWMAKEVNVRSNNSGRIRRFRCRILDRGC
jgi:tRNA A-37 threonylcarbamoyl transferase component Bud32